MEPTDTNPTNKPPKGGCLGIFILAFLGFWLVVMCGLLTNFGWVASQVAQAEWVIDPDTDHPGYARAMPVAVAMGRSDQQMVLPLNQPYTFPIGCVRTNNTTGDFKPACE